MSIDAMKQALAALEDAVSALRSEMAWRSEMGFRSCIDAAEPWAKAAEVLRAAIEQVQEPVAWMYHGIRHDDTPHERPSLIWKPEYMDVMSAEKGAKATPLYTAPRQWQGLTDEEVSKLIDNEIGFNSCWGPEEQFARAIEARLKEKNHG